MTATILDGKAAAKAWRAELAVRVAALAETGVKPAKPIRCKTPGRPIRGQFTGTLRRSAAS